MFFVGRNLYAGTHGIEPMWFGFGFGIAWQSKVMAVMGIHYIPSRGAAAARTLWAATWLGWVRNSEIITISAGGR